MYFNRDISFFIKKPEFAIVNFLQIRLTEGEIYAIILSFYL